ncbi:MAG: hypothetical protein KF703_08375 [Actinobacteria bacterium]|nr:hypothetical protein [Actinomycetota bacterium]
MEPETSESGQPAVVSDRLVVAHDWDPFEAGDEHGRFHGFVTSDGWVYWRRMGTPEVRVRVDATGPRIAITAVLVLPREDVLDWPPTVSATDLREVPLGQLEAMMNSPKLAAFIRKSQSGAVDGGDGGGSLDEYLDRHGQHYRLDGVRETSRPDMFYAELAFIWAQALSAGHKNPATLIAQANDVSPSAVYRWVREARRRGVMAPSGRALAAQRRAQATQDAEQS